MALLNLNTRATWRYWLYLPAQVYFSYTCDMCSGFLVHGKTICMCVCVTDKFTLIFYKHFFFLAWKTNAQVRARVLYFYVICAEHASSIYTLCVLIYWISEIQKKSPRKDSAQHDATACSARRYYDYIANIKTRI